MYNGFTIRGLKDVLIDPAIKENIIDSMMWWRPGDIVENFLVAKFGIAFLKFDSTDELLEKSKNMQDLISAKVSDNCE